MLTIVSHTVGTAVFVAVGGRVAVRVGVAVFVAVGGKVGVAVGVRVGVKVLPASKLHTDAPLPAHGEFGGTLQSGCRRGLAKISPGSGA